VKSDSPVRAVHEPSRPGDVRDPAMTELQQVVHGGGDPCPVVQRHGGQPVPAAWPAHGHEGQAELAQQCRSPVTHVQVGEEDPVRPAGRREPPVHRLLPAVLDDLQHQRLAAGREDGLHARDERREERVGAEQLGRACDDQTDGERPRRRQCTCAGVGRPAQLVRGGEDALAGGLADTRSAVERERDRPVGDVGEAGDVLDRRFAACGHGRTKTV
jgi:hypothetical protein